MPKRITLIIDDKFRDRFTDAYQAKNEFTWVHKIKDLQRIFKISEWTCQKVCKSLGLSRNKKGATNA